MKEQLSLIEHFETSKAFSLNLDTKDESALNLSNFKKHLELNMSMQDTKIDNLTQERERIIN